METVIGFVFGWTFLSVLFGVFVGKAIALGNVDQVSQAELDYVRSLR